MNAKTKAAPKKKAAAKKSLVIEQSNQLATDQPQSPIQQMQVMKQMGLEVSDMRDMLALQKEYEANEALKQYNIALSAFKAENIQIIKDQTVSYDNSDGSKTTYNHSSLANIIETVTPALSGHGLSTNWSTQQADGGITVTCYLTHKSGHSEQTSLKASPDNSGGKNPIQAVASTVKYLERYTLLALLGLAERDKFDDDGAGADEPDLTISDEQLLELDGLITETNSDRQKFLAACNVVDLALLPASRFAAAKQALEDKKRLTA